MYRLFEESSHTFRVLAIRQTSKMNRLSIRGTIASNVNITAAFTKEIKGPFRLQQPLYVCCLSIATHFELDKTNLISNATQSLV